MNFFKEPGDPERDRGTHFEHVLGHRVDRFRVGDSRTVVEENVVRGPLRDMAER